MKCFKSLLELSRRLDVAERVLAHESKFIESIPVDTVVESDLVAQVDEYFESREDEASDENLGVITMAECEPSAL